MVTNMIKQKLKILIVTHKSPKRTVSFISLRPLSSPTVSLTKPGAVHLKMYTVAFPSTWNTHPSDS